MTEKPVNQPHAPGLSLLHTELPEVSNRAQHGEADTERVRFVTYLAWQGKVEGEA